MSPVTTSWPAPLAVDPVRGRVAVPGSKSVTNRALLLAALSGGSASVSGAPATRDTALMVGALRALGVAVEVDGEHVTFAAHGGLRGGGTVDCGLAGTVMRFVPPAAALADGPVAFDGDERARSRPMGTVLDALRALGASVDGTGLPFTLHGTGGLPGGDVVDIDEDTLVAEVARQVVVDGACITGRVVAAVADEDLGGLHRVRRIAPARW